MNAREGAGLIGGMIQGSEHFHPIWESLKESDVDALRELWANELAGPDPKISAERIEDSINNHPELGRVWEKLERLSKDARSHAILSIATEVSGT